MAKRACALHILVKTEAECLALKQQLDKGADFGKLAKQHSICPSGKRGGDLGEFSKGDMVGPFDKAVFTGPELKVQGPVKTRFGYHLIKVLYRN
ncbi:peptidylprolyl isomerase [Zobellella denitrificans]|jgi:peptidyl-prolyl cis-trans isomerase C|uniref:Peptidyl-prolyl cis-trans isomerase C n=1 Tax=Zobellella denitrificans TaxID=347534 RepID=A0A231MYU2_9GAMM|nr:peptidylprolyl isomerase PpiC [Zobellella denitrificans]ATG73844.1 peptidylprolyl isomerase [Zobellella denitrificans]OXS15357.1 peptidylprolyl isomerase [Zobellella denitrificans]